MSEPEREAEGLVTAKAQFLEAEKRLRELAQGAVELTRASVMLKKARMGLTDGAEALRDLSGRLSEYIGSLADVTDQLSAAATTPRQDEETRARLDAIQKQLTQLDTDLSHSTPAEDAASVLGHRTEELQIVTETLTAHLGTLEDLATELSQSRALRAEDSLDKVLSRLDDMKSGAEEAGKRAAVVQLPPEIEETLKALPEIGAGLAGVASTVRAADLEGTPRRLAALEEGIIALRSLMQQAADRPVESTIDESALVDLIERRLVDVTAHIRAADPADATAKLLTMETRLGGLQESIDKLGRRIRTGDTSDGQMELLPDVENGLIALAQEMHAREVITVDMLAELRRSLGRELQKGRKELTSALGIEAGKLGREISLLRRMLWAVALIAVGGLALALFQIF